MDPLSAINSLPTPGDEALPYARLVRLPAKIPAAEIQEIPNAVLDTTTAPVAPAENIFAKLIGEVNSKHQVAGQTVAGLLSGENVPLHRAMIAMEEASLSFQLMVEVRNKLLESYHELMRMQV